ncbi:MAG: efflux RND transporter periplasmic adaptor subunit [Eubacterium ramulus]
MTADTSALEAELEKASNTLAELQSRLSSQQAVAESDPSAVTAEEKEKMEITNNLSELDQMSAQELVEAAKKGIKADFNGVITKVSVEGATTALGTELFTLQNTDKINVNVNVSKYDYDKLKEGQSADITLAGKTYEGEVTSISHVATQNEKGASLISADVRIKNPDDDIFLGVDAKVTIHAEEADDVVVLPSEVVNIGKDGSFCYVIENGVITRRDITTGISSDDYVEVTEGIKEGDEVIRDLGSLEEGMQAEATLSESADNGSQSNLTDAEEGA